MGSREKGSVGGGLRPWKRKSASSFTISAEGRVSSLLKFLKKELRGWGLNTPLFEPFRIVQSFYIVEIKVFELRGWNCTIFFYCRKVDEKSYVDHEGTRRSLASLASAMNCASDGRTQEMQKFRLIFYSCLIFTGVNLSTMSTLVTHASIQDIQE